MNTNNMNKSEKSLLLFLETCCVDRSGGVDLKYMSKEDLEMALDWDKSGFVSFKRIASEFLPRPSGSTYDCHLSDKAWNICFKVRRERAERMYGLRSWRNIQEIKEVEKT